VESKDGRGAIPARGIPDGIRKKLGWRSGVGLGSRFGESGDCGDGGADLVNWDDRSGIRVRDKEGLVPPEIQALIMLNAVSVRKHVGK
jgi:hypothetical protein